MGKRFETELLAIPNYQGKVAVNYTERETPWTRIIEYKYYDMDQVIAAALERVEGLRNLFHASGMK